MQDERRFSTIEQQRALELCNDTDSEAPSSVGSVPQVLMKNAFVVRDEAGLQRVTAALREQLEKEQHATRYHYFVHVSLRREPIEVDEWDSSTRRRLEWE